MKGRLPFWSVGHNQARARGLGLAPRVLLEEEAIKIKSVDQVLHVLSVSQFDQDVVQEVCLPIKVVDDCLQLCKHISRDRTGQITLENLNFELEDQVEDAREQRHQLCGSAGQETPLHSAGDVVVVALLEVRQVLHFAKLHLELRPAHVQHLRDEVAVDDVQDMEHLGARQLQVPQLVSQQLLLVQSGVSCLPFLLTGLCGQARAFQLSCFSLATSLGYVCFLPLRHHHSLGCDEQLPQLCQLQVDTLHAQEEGEHLGACGERVPGQHYGYRPLHPVLQLHEI
mmetsp:Transcript_8564/g.12788  ORF Transcript_8564/g.12788 Transcript_8564/m.12788 type:complete len:283 (-) Transcript_8564:413-1261(-)